MQKDRSSLTAAGIALARAIESEKPADERICFDLYARQFVPVWMFQLLGFFIRSGYAELRGPGVIGFLMARTRFIDDVLSKFLADGFQQLVILGAGYDSRAYRFDLSGRVKTFEVDHPATQADKFKKLKVIFGRIPDHVSYTPIDFNTQTLSMCLLESGYDPNLKTLFIWEGVTMYLTPEAVDATLEFPVKYSASGSAIVFDYIYHEVLDGFQKHNEVKNMRRYRFMTGEGLTFGIAENAIESFLKERGFSEVQDTKVGDLRAAYLTGKKVGRKIAGGYGIVIGFV